MPEQLKPVSDALRKALALLGETPEQHQAEVLARKSGGGGRKPASPSARSHALPPAPKLTPAEEIAQRWLSHNWRPVARVLFLREAHCRHCGQTSVCAHWPETFIKERLVKDPKSFRYLPAKSSIAASVKLPHIVERLRMETTFCHQCFLTLSHSVEEPTQCLEDLLLSQLAGTASSPSGTSNPESPELTSPVSSALESSSAATSSSPPNSSHTDLDSSPTSSERSQPQTTSDARSTSPEAGYTFASSASDQFVLALPTISPTTLAKADVEVESTTSSTEHKESI